MGAIYIDIVNDVKFAWKIQRDVAERGWTEEQVKEDIDKRLPDFAKYVDPQKKDADVILRYEPSDQELPFLKVKLIQKKDGAFPMISLKKELSLAERHRTAPGRHRHEDSRGLRQAHDGRPRVSLCRHCALPWGRPFS